MTKIDSKRVFTTKDELISPYVQGLEIGKQKSKEFVDDAIQQVKRLEKELNTLNFGTVDGIKKLSNAEKELEVITAELAKQRKIITGLEKELDKARAKGNKTQKKTLEQQVRDTEIRREQRKVIKGQVRDQEGLSTEYERQSRRLNELIKEFRDLELTEQGNTKRARELREEIQRLDKRLKDVDQTVGRNQRNVGNYGSAFGKLRGGIKALALRIISITAIITGLGRVLRSGARIVANYDQGVANLASVLGVTREETALLTAQAEELGATSAKSATEVLQLQESLARLGFTQQEIIDLTPAIINGSIALRAETAETASLVGAIVRTFEDLDTTDAPAIIDSLTASTQQSALNFERLATAVPIVGGAANQAGVPLNRLLALLGKLSDSGIDASTSATALRNIFIESASQGLSYSEILDKIISEQDKLTAATDEFGKRAAVSASILAENIKATNDLAESLANASGTAEMAAKEQLNTLQGRITLLKSAFEGFILSIEQGDGAIARFARGIVDFAAGILNAASGLEEVSKSTLDLAKETRFLAQENQNLLSTYDRLSAEEELSTAQKIELDGVTNELIKRFGESVVAINAETGALELNREAILKNIQAQVALQTEQARELVAQRLRLQVQIEQGEQAQKLLDASQDQIKGNALLAQSTSDLTNTDVLLFEGTNLLIQSSQKFTEQTVIEAKSLIDLAGSVRQANDASKELAEVDAELLKQGIDLDALVTQQTETFKSNTAAIKENDEAIKSRILSGDELNKQIEEFEKNREAERKKRGTEIDREFDRVNKGRQNEIDSFVSDEEKKRKIEEDLAEQRIQSAKKVVDSIINEINRENQARLQSIDREITSREQQVNRQVELAKLGVDNTLAFEQEQLAKAEREREQLQDEQERRERRLAFLRLVAGFAQSDPENANVKALQESLVSLAIAGAFADGTEDLKGPGTTTSDDILAWLSRGESVITAKGTAANQGLATALNSGNEDEWIAKNKAHLAPQMLNNYINNSSVSKHTGASVNVEMYYQMISELKNVQKAIKSQPQPVIDGAEIDLITQNKIKNSQKKSTKRTGGRSIT